MTAVQDNPGGNGSTASTAENMTDRGRITGRRLAFIVTEFPKTTETFIMRDVMDLSQQGFEIRIFHLTRFNKRDTVHDFARPTLEWAVDHPYLLSFSVLKSVVGRVRKQPGTVFWIVADIVKECRKDPIMLLKSLFILPKSMRIADDLEIWSCEHVHAAYAGHPATTAWIVRRLTGISFSCSSHAHDLFETQALLQTKLPEASFVRTISEYNKTFILNHVPQLAGHPPVVIHVGDYLSDAPVGQTAPRSTFRILYVGSLEYRKGVDLLLRAVARLRIEHWTLDIIGDGPERNRLQALTAELGIGPRVTYYGRSRNEAVRTAMKAASVLAVPSRIGPRNQTEGLPTVIVEAFAQELPVIASRLTGIPEIVRPNETGVLFEMNDLYGLTDAIMAVHDNPETAIAEAKAGRALVLREFDQKVNSGRLGDLIREVCAPAGQSHL